MKKIIEIKTIAEYNAMMGVTTLHPLVSIIDFSKTPPPGKAYPDQSYSFPFYAVFLKYGKKCELLYGRNNYDYQDGTLVFIAPNQILSVGTLEADIKPEGFALLFHPDLIRGTTLGQHMKDYSFFLYNIHEALHLNSREKELVIECFNKINFELQQSIDKHSKRLIVSNVELFLQYCIRYYDRQFITRDPVYSDILTKFETHLQTYFDSEKPQNIGLPSVAYFADQFHLSPNYFGDLIKKETGKTPQEFIQLLIIDLAKEKILDRTKPISEVAYELGFKYPQHFTRFFKQHIGNSPIDYRRLN